MKVKQRPEDFRVEEVSRLRPGAGGPFALYRLQKAGIGTLEALVALCRAWNVPRRAVSFAGLKDRHAETAQTVSVRGGPERNFEGRGFRLNYLGRSPRPAARGTILRNRFRVVLRDLGAAQARLVTERARAAAERGVPDYYDDQRFGSVRGTDGAFVARALLAGDPERALRLAIASPARRDRSRIKRRRRLLAQRWGEWQRLSTELDSCAERRICGRLAGGASFADAYSRLDPAIRSLHLAAWQAHLFNTTLRAAVGEGPSHPGIVGPYVFFEGERPDLRDERFPLASAQAPPHAGLDGALEAEGLDRGALRALPFRSGARAALFFPEELRTAAARPDELNSGRCKLRLEFELRAGSYATMLIKRCTHDL
ncbi:MAG: tRNA pseudouridine(13) synthase TruD [Planctomycetota bacterium]